MTEKDYAVYRYLEKVAEENPDKWVSKEELIDEFPQFFVKGEDSHDICSTLNMVRLNINRARASGKVSHLVLLKNHQFKLAVSKDEAEKSIQKDYNNAMKLLKRYWQNRGAIKEDGQGKLIDCNGNTITDESLAKRFQMPFDYNPSKKYKLSELIKKDKIAIHTPTEENANALLNVLDRLYEWGSFEKLTSSNNEYQRYGQNTCYATSIRLNGKTYIEYEDLYFYGEKGREIVEFDDIDLEN